MAVSISTDTLASGPGRARMRRQTSRPSVSGSIRSRITRSGACCCSCSRPVAPSPAWLKAKPDCVRYSPTICARRASSSIIRSWGVLMRFMVVHREQAGLNAP
ncbi:hypothetical protein FQZ97_1004380 [compost metagenome]